MGNLIKCEDHILKKIFDCFVVNGLERTSIRDLCEATGLSTSSIYYRFENKDKIILESAYLGLVDITKELFWAAVIKINSFPELFDAVLNNVELRKKRIRLIYQIATSPQYGDAFREKTSHISEVYKNYVEMLAKQLGCSEDYVMPYVYLFIAVVREYIVWGNKEHAEKALHYIYDKLVSNGN